MDECPVCRGELTKEGDLCVKHYDFDINEDFAKTIKWLTELMGNEDNRVS